MKLSHMLSYLLSSAFVCSTALLSTTSVQAESADENPASTQQGLAELSVLSVDAIGEVAYNYNAPILADRGAPPGRRGGGSRGCLEDNNHSAGNESLDNGNSQGTCVVTLTALTPATHTPFESNSEGLVTNTYESVLSLTTQDRPTLWFYIPYDLDAITLEFTLSDEDEKQLYQANVSINSASGMGIVQVTLPLALQMNNRYKWLLLVEDDADDFQDVSGTIERVPLDPDLRLPLAEASPRDQAVIYARNGLWQEAVTLLGQLYRADPDNINLANDWYSLLESVDLEDFAQLPFVDCCTL